MRKPGYRPAPSDPVWQQLTEVRRGLFRLHKALIDSERAAFERGRGPMSSGEFLQSLIHDDFFAWLRPFSALIVEMDELLAAKEPVAPPTARDFLARTRVLVEPDDAGRGEHYERVCSHDPDVLLAHLELAQRIRSAQEAIG